MSNKIRIIDIMSSLKFKTKQELLDKMMEVYPMYISGGRRMMARFSDEKGERLSVHFKLVDGYYVISDYYVEDNLFNIYEGSENGFENDLKGMSEKMLFERLQLFNEILEEDNCMSETFAKRELIISELIKRRK